MKPLLMNYNQASGYNSHGDSTKEITQNTSNGRIKIVLRHVRMTIVNVQSNKY